MRLTLPLIITFVYSCTQPELQSEADLSERIGKQAISSDNRFRLSDLTNFDWDSLLILVPYASYEHWEDSLNIELSAVEHVMINSKDYINHLIFFHNGSIVKSIEPSRYPGDFARNGSRIIHRNEDEFQIIVTPAKSMGYKDWIDIVWIDPQVTEDFNNFLVHFNTDPQFQLSRIVFPHEQEIIDPHEGGVAFLIFEDSTEWIMNPNLEYREEYHDGVGLEYDQDTIWNGNIVTIQQRGDLALPETEIGWYVDYVFTNIEGQWYLTSSKDLGY